MADADDLDNVKLYVEMWKVTIDVQKHFNDIELRIRGLALTVLTFTLGAAAVAIKDKTTFPAGHHRIHLSSVILLVGVVVWLAFYFVDRVWYHRLLIGSVVHGEALETEIAKRLPLAGLTKQIRASSQSTFRIPFFRFTLYSRSIHSTGKLKIFYSLVTAVLVIFSVAAQAASLR